MRHGGPRVDVPAESPAALCDSNQVVVAVTVTWLELYVSGLADHAVGGVVVMGVVMAVQAARCPAPCAAAAAAWQVALGHAGSLELTGTGVGLLYDAALAVVAIDSAADGVLLPMDQACSVCLHPATASDPNAVAAALLVPRVAATACAVVEALMLPVATGMYL